MLRFMFSGFWIFVGHLILISVLGSLAYKLWYTFFDYLLKRKRGGALKEIAED